MIKWLSSQIRRIVGRIKKYMNLTTFAVSIGAIFIPIAVYILVEGDTSDKWLAFLMFFTGLALLITAMIRVYIEQKETTNKKKKEDALNDAKFDALLEEIKGLRQDIGGTNERRYRKTKGK